MQLLFYWVQVARAFFSQVLVIDSADRMHERVEDDVFHTQHKAESMVSILCEPQLRNTCGKYVCIQRARGRFPTENKMPLLLLTHHSGCTRDP